MQTQTNELHKVTLDLAQALAQLLIAVQHASVQTTQPQQPVQLTSALPQQPVQPTSATALPQQPVQPTSATALPQQPTTTTEQASDQQFTAFADSLKAILGQVAPGVLNTQLGQLIERYAPGAAGPGKGGIRNIPPTQYESFLGEVSRLAETFRGQS